MIGGRGGCYVQGVRVQGVYVRFFPVPPSVHPSIRVYIHPSIHPSIHQSINQSIHPLIRPPTHPSTHPSIHPSTQPSNADAFSVSVWDPSHQSISSSHPTSPSSRHVQYSVTQYRQHHPYTRVKPNETRCPYNKNPYPLNTFPCHQTSPYPSPNSSHPTRVNQYEFSSVFPAFFSFSHSLLLSHQWRRICDEGMQAVARPVAVYDEHRSPLIGFDVGQASRAPQGRFRAYPSISEQFWVLPRLVKNIYIYRPIGYDPDTRYRQMLPGDVARSYMNLWLSLF